MTAPLTPVPNRTLIAYALPALPLAAMYFPVFVFLSEFYAAERAMSLATIGLILLAVRGFDAVSDPLVGYLSDRTPARLGRRKVWLLGATPVVMIATWQLFVPPQGVGAGWFALWLFVLTAGWTLAMTPYFAWGAELSGDYRERAKIALSRESLGLTGTILAGVLYGIGANSAAGLTLIATLVVLLLPAAVAVCLRAVPEPVDYSKAAPRLGDAIRTIRERAEFRRLLIAYFINGAANGIAATLFVFFVSYRLDAPDMSGPLLVVYFAAAVIGAPLWNWATGRWSKHRIWCVAMVYAGFVFVWTITLGAGDWTGFLVICVLSGLALGADLALPTAMQADLVDVATAETGTQQTGAFFALWSVATKLALAVAGAGSLVFLDLVGFDVGADNQGSALTALALLYGLGPIVLKMIAVAMMWSFPVDATTQGRLRSVIES